MSFITLDNLTLELPVIYDPRQLSLRKKLLQIISLVSKKNESHHISRTKTTLTNINLAIKQGDRVGLIGRNGAGKTTLLHVMAGIYIANQGYVKTQGSILPLFDINVGIEPEATGYENIVLQSLCLGLNTKQAKALIPDIEEFTELDGALHNPVNTYSSGMSLRLAFAIITAMKSDILLMDEIVAAGDTNFHVKAKQRLNKLLDGANILVLASHREDIIREYCNKAILMDKGKVLYFGDIDTAFKMYKDL